MKSKAVFTISAKNYLSQALTLGQSIKENSPDTDFYILLADVMTEEVKMLTQDFTVFSFAELGVISAEDMAFKYDVIEFNTSTKPFFFDYLFTEKNYDQVLYIDPDCYVYQPLNTIFSRLDNNFCVLTPHAIKPQLIDEGAIKESDHLWEGIYNCGFIGISNTKNGLILTEWWKNRLRDMCYADRIDALHVDQKWIDYVPSMFEKGVDISFHPGMNASHWNMHEREYTFKDNIHYMDNEELIFYHFSGYNPFDENCITKVSKQTKYDLINMPHYKNLYDAYRLKLIKNGYEKFLSMGYSYSTFNNGVVILPLHRRLYRELSKSESFTELFSEQGDFYKLLLKNKLIDEKIETTSVSKSAVSNIDLKYNVLKFMFLMAKKIFGIKRYYMLIKAVNQITRFEAQTFLIKK
jgi:hypothetical protein